LPAEPSNRTYRVIGLRADGTRAVLATGLAEKEARDAIRFIRAQSLAGASPEPLAVAFETVFVEPEDSRQ
jgi:hypothetical protein